MNGHRSFDMYQMINDFGSLLEYDDLNMFLEKYALQEGYSLYKWQCSITIGHIIWIFLPLKDRLRGWPRD